MKNPPLNETPEQRKIRLERAALELFADINNSFGKVATAKKAKEKSTSPKEDSLTTFMKETNAIAKAMESPAWKPVAIVHYIIKQKCECCGKTPECVGGTLVRHSHAKRKDTWDFPRPDIRSLSHLPQIIIEEETPVQLCPECIRAGYFDKMAFCDEIANELKAQEQTVMLAEMNPIELWQRDHDDSGEEIIIGDEE